MIDRALLLDGPPPVERLLIASEDGSLSGDGPIWVLLTSPTPGAAVVLMVTEKPERVRAIWAATGATAGVALLAFVPIIAPDGIRSRGDDGCLLYRYTEEDVLPPQPDA